MAASTRSHRPLIIPRPVLILQSVQATAVLGLGLTYLLTTPHTIHSISKHISDSIPILPATAAVSPAILNHNLLAQQQHFSATILLGIGTVYASSLYHRQYEYVYLSIPGRLVIAATVVFSWMLAPERVGVVLMLAGVNDGLGALVSAWFLGWESLVGKVEGEKVGKRD